MNGFDRAVSRFALPVILATLLFIPLGTWFYEGIYLLSRYSEGTKVFTIWWDGNRGITLDRITAYNYWLKRINRLEEIRVNKGDRVVLRLISSDVYHGFTLPAFGIDEVVIKPGEVEEVEFVAEKAGEFLFFCTIACGPAHPDIRARLIVVEPEGERVARVGGTNP